MTEDQDRTSGNDPDNASRCAECGTRIEEGMDFEAADGGTFCRPCYNNLTERLNRAITVQAEGINYPMAVVGAFAGAVVGVVAWWGFTVLTHIAFGLFAIVIGLAVAKGTVLFAGNKRAVGLQVISVLVSALAFVYASYLVNRTFVNEALQTQGTGDSLPFVPDPALLMDIVSLDAGLMDLLFLGIVVYEAWTIPAPIRLKPTS